MSNALIYYFLLLLQLFDFAVNHKGLYQQSIPSAQSFYSSSGYNVCTFHTPLPNLFVFYLITLINM